MIFIYGEIIKRCGSNILINILLELRMSRIPSYANFLLRSKYLSCEGFLGVNYYCVYRGLFFAFSSVGTMCGDGYDDYKYHEEELQKNLDARSVRTFDKHRTHGFRNSLKLPGRCARGIKTKGINFI